MKRDMKLIRRMLIAIEEDKNTVTLEKLRLLDLDEKKADHHVWLMLKGGLINANVKHYNGSLACGVIQGLSYEGQDFLDAIRGMVIFNMTDHVLSQRMDIATFETYKEVAQAFAKSEALKSVKHSALR